MAGTALTHGAPRRRTRLLIVTGAAGYEEGGTVLVPSEQVERFRALPRRFDTTLVIKRSEVRSTATSPLPQGFRVTWIDPYPSKWSLLSPRHFLSLRRDIRGHDALLCLMPLLDGLPPLFLSVLTGTPRYVYVIASSIHLRFEAQGSRLVRSVARTVLNISAMISKRVFVNGRGLAEELWRPLLRKVDEVVISTLSEEDFAPVEREPGGRLELLCVCRLVPSKRVDVAIDMVRLLTDRGVDVRLTVVGDGPLRERLVRRASERGMGEQVVFAGFVDDRQRLRDLYRTSDVFVLPTEMEGVSLAIQEAMAAGLAVVSTDAGALAYFLHDGVDSLVVRTMDPMAFADAVGRLAASPSIRLQIAGEGQRMVSKLGNAAWVDRVADLVEADLRDGDR